jgi:hypothetical protein
MKSGDAVVRIIISEERQPFLIAIMIFSMSSNGIEVNMATCWGRYC